MTKDHMWKWSFIKINVQYKRTIQGPKKQVCNTVPFQLLLHVRLSPFKLLVHDGLEPDNYIKYAIENAHMIHFLIPEKLLTTV